MYQLENIQWVVQRNLTGSNDFNEIRKACELLNIPFVPLDIIPFSPSLPSFDKTRRSIIYGSTTFYNLALNDPSLKEGIFFNEQSFSIENYIKEWGAHMLNYNARITTFQDLLENKNYSADQLLFIRPNDDNKSFAGEIKRYQEIADWFKQLSGVENSFLNSQTKIVIAEPYNIQYEWRLWLVNGKVVAASKYREYFKLKKERGCPDAVKIFAEARCSEFMPHDVFVMDICVCGDEFYIVECGCMNAAGFYAADIGEIVAQVSAYFIANPFAPSPNSSLHQ